MLVPKLMIGRLLVCSVIGAGVSALPPMASAQDRPDLSGIWRGAENTGARRTGYELTPEGARLHERNKAAIAAQDPEIDTALQCLPTGMVRTMVGLPLVLVQSPVAVAIVAEADVLPRIIYLDRPHREDYWPTYMGDSVGHWEGDTLVVETVNFNTRTFTDMAGLPHSDQLRVVERFRKLPDGNLQILMTIEDPVVFVRPWTVDMTFQPSEYLPVESVCENTRDRPEHSNTVP